MYLYVDASYLANATANSLPPESLRHGPPAVALEIIAKVAQFIRSYQATRVYWCLDPKGGSWRKQVHPSYKAHRAEKLAKDPVREAAHVMATTCIEEVLPELISLMGCPNFQYPWIEADDMAAAAVALNVGKPGILITADNDYLQLINATTYMIDPVHSLRYQLGEDGKIWRYKGDGTVESTGLTPQESLLCKALQGDASDNLPGLIGVGEVTATKAIIEKRVPTLLAEETGMVTPRKSKNNPTPVPVAQDARAVVALNLSMMDLFNSRIHQKVKVIVSELEQKSIRQIATNFTRFSLWLEQRHQFATEQANQTAQFLCTTYRNQWTS
jgi:5'-3' exonuclease